MGKPNNNPYYRPRSIFSVPNPPLEGKYSLSLDFPKTQEEIEAAKKRVKEEVRKIIEEWKNSY